MRPSIITSDHLARLAVGYGRQSTMEQVEKNTGSTEYQRGQLRHAREWGWPEDRILWRDDFGLSGRAASHRPGYLEIRQLVRESKVGIVLVSGMTRLGRNAAELLNFIEDCAVYGTLLAEDGRVVDPKDPGDWLKNAILIILGEHGGNSIRDTLQQGRLAKLDAGIAVSYPPVGYDQGPGKTWTMTSDPTIRSALVRVFAMFFECRSLRRTVVRLRSEGVMVPRRKPGHPVHWRQATCGVLKDIISNPNYTPDYYYRRHIDDPTKPRSAKGRRRPRKAKPEEVRVLPDHHEGYLTREQWAEIQTIFARNAWSRSHGTLGKGAALVQGILSCGDHAVQRMSARYKHGPEDWKRSYFYRCNGQYFEGLSKCCQIPGARVDDAVAAAVLRRLEPPSIDAVRIAFERSVANARAAQRHRDIERARLMQQIAGLNAKLEVIDASLTHAVQALARRVNQAELDLEKLQDVDEAARLRVIQTNQDLLAQAAELARDVPVIWGAATTSDRDRKEIVRLVLRRVVLEKRSREELTLRLQWVDGADDEVIVVSLQDGVVAWIEKLSAAGLSHDEIARRLDEMGMRTRRGNPFTGKRVRQAIYHRVRATGRSADAPQAHRPCEVPE